METATAHLFETLYFLESNEFYLVETKRNDLDQQVPVSEKFQWLKIPKSTMEPTPLSFSAMDSSGEVEERFFEEGFLKFNAQEGTFIEKYNSAQHQLANRSHEMLPIELYTLLGPYLTL